MPPPGSPPFAYRPAFMIAGRRPVSEAEEAEARELQRRIIAVRRARKEPEPNLEHLLYSEPRNRVGLYAEWPPEFAPAIYRLEMADARDKAFMGRRCIKDDAGTVSYGPWQQRAQSISAGEPRKDEAALVQHLLLGPACFHWSDERVLDLFLYRAQPLLSACRAALKMLNLAFQFPDPIFGSSQLKREPMRHGHRSLDVLFGDVSCFLQQSNHGVPSSINRFKFGSWLLLRSKSHDFSLGGFHFSLLMDACVGGAAGWPPPFFAPI